MPQLFFAPYDSDDRLKSESNAGCGYGPDRHFRISLSPVRDVRPKKSICCLSKGQNRHTKELYHFIIIMSIKKSKKALPLTGAFHQLAFMEGVCCPAAATSMLQSEMTGKDCRISNLFGRIRAASKAETQELSGKPFCTYAQLLLAFRCCFVVKYSMAGNVLSGLLQTAFAAAAGN